MVGNKVQLSVATGTCANEAAIAVAFEHSKVAFKLAGVVVTTGAVVS